MSEVELDVQDITAPADDRAAADANVKHENPTLLGDLWSFMKERKKWWLLPILVLLVLVGILIIAGQSSSVSPFIYALF